MALHIKDSKTDQLVRQLAQMRGIGITEAIFQAVSESIAADNQEHTPKVDALRRRLQPLLDEMKSYTLTGAKADKEFFDDLYDEPHGDFSQTDMK